MGLDLVFKIQGVDEYVRQSTTAAERIRTHVRDALNELGGEIRDRAAAAAPYSRLAAAMYRQTYQYGQTLRVVVRPKRSDEWLARIYEKGFPRQKVVVKEYVRGKKARQRVKRLAGKYWRKAYRQGKLGSYVPGFVHGYQREHEVKQQAFIGPALNAVAPTIMDRIRDAIDRALVADAASKIYDAPE